MTEPCVPRPRRQPPPWSAPYQWTFYEGAIPNGSQPLLVCPARADRKALIWSAFSTYLLIRPQPWDLSAVPFPTGLCVENSTIYHQYQYQLGPLVGSEWWGWGLGVGSYYVIDLY